MGPRRATPVYRLLFTFCFLFIMKNTWYITLLALVLALPAQLRAQEYKLKFNSPTGRKRN